MRCREEIVPDNVLERDSVLAERAHGLAVMTTPLHGVDHRFKSGWAHSMLQPDNYPQIPIQTLFSAIAGSCPKRELYASLTRAYARSALARQ